MMSATTAIELEAPVEIVWQVVADLDRYGEWNPCFGRVYGALRANETLDVDLHVPEISPASRPVTALVLDVQRYRRLRWLLVSSSCSNEDRSNDQDEVGVYEVELVALGPARVRLVQRLMQAPGQRAWPADRTELRQRLEAMNEALQDRVAWSAANLSPAHQIEGTIRVSSHCGRGPSARSQRSGLLACLAELVGHRPRAAAA